MKLHRPLRNSLALSFFYGVNLLVIRECAYNEFEMPNRFHGRLLGSILGVAIPVFFFDCVGLLTQYGFLRLTQKRPLSIPIEMITFATAFALQQGLVELLALHYYGFSPFVSYTREMMVLRHRMATSFVSFVFFYLVGELYGFHLLLLNYLLP